MSTDTVVVFLGPTLDLAEARSRLAAVYLPPAGQGDFVRAILDHRPATVALIDGVFGNRPAVRHKEILWALSLGVEVHGASSMGALRAAELHPFGMRGHGLVYRWYRRTPLADDDDVAVPTAPVELGSVALGDPLINLRLTFRAACRQAVINAKTRVILEECARMLYFTERSFETVIALAHNRGGDGTELDRFKAWLPGRIVDAKRADALALLELLAAPRPARGRPTAAFAVTEAWALDLDDAGLWSDWRTSGRDTGAR